MNLLYLLKHNVEVEKKKKKCGAHFFIQVEKKGPGGTQTASVLILEKF